MNPKMEQARHLYFNCGMTQRDIAAKVGISERTLYNWIRQHAWEQLKRAAYQAPAMIAENLCSQLVELQNTIAARELGSRYPTKDEAEVTRKLLAGMEKVKKYPTKSQTLQVFASFRDFLRNSYGKDAARAFGMQMMSFLDNDPVNGYQPYNMEFGIDKIAPILPFYDEDFDEEHSEENACEPSPPLGGGQVGLQQPETALEKQAESLASKPFAPDSGTSSIPAKVGSKSEKQPHNTYLQHMSYATPPSPWGEVGRGLQKSEVNRK
ncbi:MAG: helix-turn-helix domain-containing protein [Bacteroidota bacterium]